MIEETEVERRKAGQGGSPMLIQNRHDPECDHCNRRMRFLFQFGEIIPGRQLADAGVGYVYGCDHHPHHCKAFIDSHRSGRSSESEKRMITGWVKEFGRIEIGFDFLPDTIDQTFENSLE